jgi:hypothetical protein
VFPLLLERLALDSALPVAYISTGLRSGRLGPGRSQKPVVSTHPGAPGVALGTRESRWRSGCPVTDTNSIERA